MHKTRIILIGGGTGVGKTTLTHQISKQLKLPVIEGDDIRIAMQEIVGIDHPINFFKDYKHFLQHTSEELTELHKKVSGEAYKGISTVVDKHIFRDQPAIFEGDDILPHLVANDKNREKVSVVFLVEDDSELLRDRLTKRLTDGGVEINESYQKYIEMALLDNQRIKEDAKKHGFETVLVSDPEAGSKLLELF